MRWTAGDVVVRREIWRGRPWLANPMYVVEDSEDVLALYVPEGSPWDFGEGNDWPTGNGLHPYHGRAAWEGEGALGLHRPGDPYAVWHGWRRPARSFVGWYVNLQLPYRRTTIGIDSLDLELDLIVQPDNRVIVKDEAQVDASAELGRFSTEDAARIHDLGRHLSKHFSSGQRWWDDTWVNWTPTPDLLVPPPLPDNWAAVPAEVVTDLGLGHHAASLRNGCSG